MSYIGNTSTQQAFTPAIDYFSGNGSTVAFTLSRPVASSAQVQVVVNNVPQNPSTAFTVLNNTITFTGAPSSGTNNIYVEYVSTITQVMQPGQGTVGATQLADGSVTPAKMSSGAPSWSALGGVSLPRIDAVAEGGQLNLNRSSDDANAWAFDVYGGGTATALRVLDTASGTEIMRWNQSGSLPLKGANTSANGTGITFPATQSASTNANTLDDYEEGTWTPSYNLDGGSVSSVASAGKYIKIGKQVSLTIYIYFGTSSSGAINTITGFPFTAEDESAIAVGSVRENSNTGYQWHIRANNNQTQGLLRRYDNNQTLTSGMAFVGTLTYIATT